MDIIRANKQSRHLVPVKDASPSLVSNGYDEAIQFNLSSDFVVNAEQDGEVIDVDEKTGFIVVRYADGKHHAINTKPEIVKNSGSAFFISNALTMTVQLGDKFKKDQVLAYHGRYFKYSKTNGLRYAIGPLVKVAFMSSYNTYEDAGVCTKKLADRIRTSIVYREDAPLTKTCNVISIANIGDKVNVGDSLLRYEESYDDSLIAIYASNLLDEDRRQSFTEDTRNNITAENAGTVIDIQVISLHDPSNLTPTLGKIVQKFFDRGNEKADFLNKYDSEGKTLKAGYLLTDSTQPLVSKYRTIDYHKNIDVLIKFFVEHEDVAGIGDKIAMYSANKQIISQIIPEGYEPYGEHRPDEEISCLQSPGTLARRMTSSVLPISMSMKIMIELKRKIKEIIRY